VQIDAPTDAATGAVKWSADKSAISCTISIAPDGARGTNYTQEQLPIFTAPTFRASVGDEYGLTRETRMKRAAKCFYSAKI
jgi:hypothetical protein